MIASTAASVPRGSSHPGMSGCAGCDTHVDVVLPSIKNCLTTIGCYLNFAAFVDQQSTIDTDQAFGGLCFEFILSGEGATLRPCACDQREKYSSGHTDR